MIRMAVHTCLLAGLAAGQALSGLSAVNGTVRDITGRLIPGAAVRVYNSQIGIDRQLETNEAGYFFSPSLPPGGGYAVSIRKDGFAAYDAQQIQLQVGQNVTLNVTLDVARQVQILTVSESTPIVEQSKTGVSEVVTASQILNLPINGRRVDSFVLLTPGVTADGTFGTVTFRGVPSGNAFLQDGNDATLQFYNEAGGRSRVSSTISQDAVQEFQVQTSGYNAEFGRAVGGVINTVSKSGTNDVHGTAYWFFRNRTLNAQDPYAAFNPPEYRHQAGGSIGGPIVADKLFYFFNGEVTRRNFPLASSIINPQFFSGTRFTGTCAAPATAAQCQAVESYLQRFFGKVPRKASQNTGFGKLDWRPAERHSFTANFNMMNFESPNGVQTGVAVTNGGALAGSNGDATVKSRWARLSYTAIVTPTMINEFRFGWFKDRQADFVNPELAPPNGLRSTLTVQGQANLGVAGFLPRVQPTEGRFQFAGNLSWSKGKHQYKFGIDIAHTRDVEEALFNGPGFFTYGSIADWAQDMTGNTGGSKRWQSYSQAFGPKLTRIFVRDYNFYAQDQWRMFRGFTVNYGIRYELAQFAQPKVFNPDYPQTGAINEPSANFAPRVGIAYAFNQDRTVFRASYGIFYARLPSATVARLHQLNGVVQKSLSLQGNNAADRAVGPVFPNPLPALDRQPPAGTVNVVFAAPDLKTPYTQQADFGVEHQITRDMSITVSYLFSRGLKFLTRRDLNIGPASGTFTYRVNDAAGNQVGSFTTPTYLRANRIDTRYSRLTYIDNGGRLWYDGLALQFRRRATNWAEGTIAYTWSHSRDLNQGGGSSNTFYTDGPSTLVNGDYSAEKGTSVLDQRHRLVMTGIVSPPRWGTSSRFADHLVNGWQLSAIITVASAQYVDPVMVITNTFTGAAFTNTLNGFGGAGRVPFLPRTSVPVDEVYRTDARLTKMFRVTERVRFNLAFEAFNLFNQIYNTSVLTQAFRAANGVLTPVSRLGNGSVSGGFPDGTNARRAQASMRLQF